MPAAKDRILRLIRQPWQSAARNFGMLGIGQGTARHGWAWRGRSTAWNMARTGSARRGKAGQEQGKECGGAVLGKARLGTA